MTIKVTAVVWGPHIELQPAAEGASSAAAMASVPPRASEGRGPERWLATASLDHTAVLWAVRDALAGTGADAAAAAAEGLETCIFRPDRLPCPQAQAYSEESSCDMGVEPVPGAEARPRPQNVRGVHRLVGHEGRVTDVAFGPPGSGWVATSSTDKTATVRGGGRARAGAGPVV